MTCITGDSKIQTTNGNKPLWQILGLSFNASVSLQSYSCTGFTTVTNEVDCLRLWDLLDHMITAGPDQQFAVNDARGWVRMGDLVVGDTLKGDLVDLRVVKSIEALIVDPQQVYECTVSGIGSCVVNGFLLKTN